jgi:rsbT co-antagonist protein RsbR
MDGYTSGDDGFFETDEIMLHVRKMQTVDWERFLDANVNDEYLSDRRRIGEIQARIGLPVMFYIVAINMV